jgi:septal ring factor EnvC (AmiA/AmiB activator)
MGKIIKSILVASLLTGGLILSSCSNSPSDEELKQLSDLKAEVSSLESQVVDKTKEKAALQKQIDEKNAKLQQCQSDQEAVKKGLGK